MGKILRSAVLMLSALSLGHTLTAADEAEKKPSDMRVIHFPNDRSIGRYVIFRDNSDLDAIKEGKLRNARGDVEVPVGMQLFLMFG